MSENDFLLYLNANNISYKVCKMLQGKKIKASYDCMVNLLLFLCCQALFMHPNGKVIIILLFILEKGITAKEFNLRLFECWSIDLKLTSMEKEALRSLLGLYTSYIFI